MSNAFFLPLFLLVGLTGHVIANTPCLINSGPPPSYKHSAFRLIVPQNALVTLHWHDALRHAAFLALRRSINSYDGNAQRAEMALWQRLQIAPVSPFDLAKPIHEDKDIITLASGVLVRQAGRLEFLPEASVLEEGNPRKVSALWTVLRVRHSGPGLSAPRIEYYFTIQPAAHLSLINHAEKQHHKVVFTKTIQKPTTLYKDVPVFSTRPKIPNVPNNIPNTIDTTIPDPIHTSIPNIISSNAPNPIPIYSNLPGQFYDPQFLAFYRNAIDKYIEKQQQQQQHKHKQGTPNLLKVNEALKRPNEPIYILPSPRLVQPPTFPRLSHLLPQNGAPNLVNIVIPRHTEGYVRFYDRKKLEPRSGEHEDVEIVTSTEVVPTTTKYSVKQSSITVSSSKKSR